MAIFYLKYRDTRPILSASLKEPDGSAYDLTNTDKVYLNITLSDGTEIAKTMTIDPTDKTTGLVTYTWLAADWDTGGLVASPALPLAPGGIEHTMEYEVVGPTTTRLTFPNDGHDILRITDDRGQGT